MACGRGGEDEAATENSSSDSIREASVGRVGPGYGNSVHRYSFEPPSRREIILRTLCATSMLCVDPRRGVLSRVEGLSIRIVSRVSSCRGRRWAGPEDEGGVCRDEPATRDPLLLSRRSAASSLVYLRGEPELREQGGGRVSAYPWVAYSLRSEALLDVFWLPPSSSPIRFKGRKMRPSSRFLMPASSALESLRCRMSRSTFPRWACPGPLSGSSRALFPEPAGPSSCASPCSTRSSPSRGRGTPVPLRPSRRP